MPDVLHTPGSRGSIGPRNPSPSLRSLTIGLAVPLVVALVLSLFVWPALRAAPRGLDVAVVGSTSVIQDVAEALDRAQPDAFDVTGVPDLEEARTAVREREVVGALVPGNPATVVTASAGSPVVAQLVVGLAATSATSTTPPVVEDVAPLPAGDPRGVVLSGGLLPLVIAGIALGASLALQRVRTRVRLIAMALGAVVSGLLFVTVLQTWLDALGGAYLADAGAVALSVAAVALPVMGVTALVGPAGIALVALVMVLVGNPLSGGGTSPVLLPTGFAQLGQLLPPGASASLLRSTSGFEGAGSAGPALVLAAWAVAGLVALGIAGRRAALSAVAPKGRATSARAEAATSPS